jgi:uncharacterized protein (UPF0548 family)
MFFLTKPTQNSIQSFLAAQKNQTFSYLELGASRESDPAGYNCDHNRIQLGTGRNVFDSAVRAVRQWEMFNLTWVQLCWPNAPIEPGATVAVLISHFGFWSLNAARIVYVLEEHGGLERYGFAYGTLRDHGERGEERFTVEYHDEDGSVWYDIFAFSRPGSVARLGYPLTRALQKRFARDSKIAMWKAIQGYRQGAKSADSE